MIIVLLCSFCGFKT